MRSKRRYIPEESVEDQRKAFVPGNLSAARIIAADPERYPGLMAEWAALIDPSSAPAIDPPRIPAAGQMGLFEERRSA